MDVNIAEEEDLFAEQILSLINDTNDDSIEDNSQDLKTTGLTLIDDNEDIFAAKDTPIGETDVLSSRSTVEELFGEMSDEELDSNEWLTKEGKLIADNLKSNDSGSVSSFETNKSDKKSQSFSILKSTNHLNQRPKDDSIRDLFSGIRLINPMVSSHRLNELMAGRKMIKMSLIKSNINKTTNDIEGDWVTIGVIVAKMGPKKSKNGKQYSIWRLSDLKTKNFVTFFLFGDVYVQHWKLSVGSVIGLLNPKLMSDEKDSKYAKNEICCLNIDNYKKLLVLGTAKDMGFCKAVKKNQEVCGALINLSEEDYCVYHIKTAYKKFSSKRAEIQSTFSNIEPKKYLMETCNQFSNTYSDGQRKDIPILESKPFTTTQFKEKKDKEMNTLSKVVKNPISKAAKNLSLSVIQSKTEDKNVKCQPFSAKDVFNSMKRETNNYGFTQFSMPSLAKGYKKGEMIDLNRKSDAKLRAIEKLKAKPIECEDPNGIKRKQNKRSLDKIISKINSELDSETHTETEEERAAKKSKSDLIERALSRKSINGHEVEIAESKAQQKYFETLERKEKMENKLSETLEMECQVISCHECKYTAHSASQLCMKSRHKLTRHKATKRFFKCKNCKNRSFTFNLLMPIKSCSKCGQTSYTKTSIVNIKDETSLLDKKLLIRGEEENKFLNKF